MACMLMISYVLLRFTIATCCYLYDGSLRSSSKQALWSSQSFLELPRSKIFMSVGLRLPMARWALSLLLDSDFHSDDTSVRSPRNCVFLLIKIHTCTRAYVHNTYRIKVSWNIFIQFWKQDHCCRIQKIFIERTSDVPTTGASVKIVSK